MSSEPEKLDLMALLPTLLPKAVAWVQAAAAQALEAGACGAPAWCDAARAVGVADPERIRIVLVEQLPCPTTRSSARLPSSSDYSARIWLASRSATRSTCGKTGSRRVCCCTNAVMCTSTRAGGIPAFLPVYLFQVLEYGYANAPLEVDARAQAARGKAKA